MTTAEAIDQIPEIVARYIPLTPPDYKCAEKRRIWVENARWRRQQLALRIKDLIIMHKPQGLSVSIDLDEILKQAK